MANAGVPCYLLDIVPSELAAEEKSRGLAIDNPLVRNRIVRAGLKAAKKARPAAFFTPDRARLITAATSKTICLVRRGGLDHRGRRGELEIKRKLLARGRTEPQARTLVTTTLGLPSAGLPEDASTTSSGTGRNPLLHPPR